MTSDGIRTRDDLIDFVDRKNRVTYVFFWGHQKNKDGAIGKGCFSQWFPVEFTVDAVVYKTAEHYMMAGKARLFKDHDMVERILESKTPAEAKKLGRLVRNFDPKVWDENNFEIVVEGNVAKFSQHPELKDFLLRTGNEVLVEASPRDRIWGIGMGATNPNAENPREWNGRNLLGFALMDVRSRLSDDT